MIFVVPFQFIFPDETLQHALDALLILWHIQRQVQEVIESVGRFFAFRTNDSGSDLASPRLIHPSCVLDLGWQVPADQRHVQGTM